METVHCAANILLLMREAKLVLLALHLELIVLGDSALEIMVSPLLLTLIYTFKCSILLLLAGGNAVNKV